MTSYKKKITKNSQGFKPASNINKNRNQEKGKRKKEKKGKKGKKGIMQVSINLSVKEYDVQRNQNEERSNY